MRSQNAVKLLVLSMCMVWLGSAPLSAGIVTFGDGIFTPISNHSTGDAVSFSENSAGATITFAATSNLVGGNRFLGMQVGNVINGLHLGGGGGSTLSFTMNSNQPVMLERYTTAATGFFLNSPAISIVGPGVDSIGNLINSRSIDSVFASGPLAIQANQDYTFTVSPTGAGVQGFVSSLTVSAVPEPSSAGFLLAALGAQSLRRRRRD